mmetsp:Transcript_21659/g.62702  ORF Transcript_21659/g.62702 Transcript_21659/m.62702 type:complete len:263 (+) Transcript_21659:223-1011(+)
MRSAWSWKALLSAREISEAVGRAESSTSSSAVGAAPADASAAGAGVPSVGAASVAPSRPLSCSSAMMSAPPTSSPRTKSCGIVGQPLNCLTASRTPGLATSSRTFTDSKVTPVAPRRPTDRALKPHWGMSGVPFMKSTASCCWTASRTASWASAMEVMPRTPARDRGARAARRLRQRRSAPGALSGRLPAGISPPSSRCSRTQLSHAPFNASLGCPGISAHLTEAMSAPASPPSASACAATLRPIAFDRPTYWSRLSRSKTA